MKIQTFSILAGSEACNAKCPFCISRMTPSQGMTLKEPEVNWRNFKIACKLAKQGEVTTAMITGKGEPTLFPSQITKYLEHLSEFEFPLIEMQTNGILIAENKQKYQPFLKEWYDLGLTTIAISVAHYEPEKNRQIYLPHKEEYIDLPGLIDYLHENGLSVRLTSMMLNGYIDSSSELEKLIDFSRDNKVEQLTVRPIVASSERGNMEMYDWTRAHTLRTDQISDVKDYLEEKGFALLDLPHGARVYDVGGQNICLSNCLTKNKDPDKTRQIIFFPDGHVRYDWEKKGAILV